MERFVCATNAPHRHPDQSSHSLRQSVTAASFDTQRATVAAATSIAMEQDEELSLQNCIDAFKDRANSVPVSEIESMTRLRQDIAQASKRNFHLEKFLSHIDERIRLLIRNQLSIHEVYMQSHGLLVERAPPKSTPIADKLKYYEQLFHLLHGHPRYFATLASHVSGDEIPLFVQTVVFDMFGDQYDTREERLLLTIFRLVIVESFEREDSMGSLLRANTAITQMLSAYARRGLGLGILKDILAKPLQDLTRQTNLNLEINPSEVYKQLISNYETSTGKKWELARDFSPDECAQFREVRRLVKPRVKQLIRVAEHFLDRIVNGVDAIPYGIRWICKQLRDLAVKRFPNADRFQIGSLIGGYICLRFFNPVIVTPDALNFIQTKPKRIMRRNLILVAKMLQNLSNGVFFKDKEVYMLPLNKFIKNQREKLADYFDRLVDIDELDDALDVDSMLQHVKKGDEVVQLSYNQLFLIHRLMNKHRKEVLTDPNDPARAILDDLGDSRDKLGPEENNTVTVRFVARDGPADLKADDARRIERERLRVDAEKYLEEIVQHPVCADTHGSNSPRTFFLDSLARSPDEQYAQLLRAFIHTMYSLSQISEMTPMDEADAKFQNALKELAMSRVKRNRNARNHEKKVKAITEAKRAIMDHQDYLESRLKLYKQYLEAVKQGGTEVARQHKPKTKKGKKKKSKELLEKYTHLQLEDMGIITRTDPHLRKSAQKCQYYFSMVESGVFKVEVVYRKLVQVKVLDKPLELKLEDLLERQQKSETVLDLEHVGLSVNLLIHFLNSKFMAKD